ncbi:MAG: hypothetical protein IJG68_03680 [Bacilli bacterium]|nr:hypothetical protein [Bacilli bacterium]
MRRNNKQVTTTFIICSLLLIGVVYAILQANLQINGIAKIKENSWNIYFDNIVINENSVSIGENDSPATIDPENNCKVDFEVTLSLPGDFYEFTVDVVNAGTIDGMIGTLNKTLKVNNEVVEDTPDYLDYTVTYSDGVEIEENHKINAGTTETYLVRLEFKTDIDELPEATTITTFLESQYLQADSSSIEVFHPFSLYNIFKTEVDNNSGLVLEYSGDHKDSFTVDGNKRIYYWYAKNDNNANTIKEKWNIIFGGFCWQMFRTTDTGGTKIIYNGIPNDGKCIASGNDAIIGNSPFNSSYTSPAFVGYMYPNDIITSQREIIYNNTIFASDINYIDGKYYLINTSESLDNTHHYSCGNANLECDSVRYYYSYKANYYYKYFYFKLENGKKIEDFLTDSLSDNHVNQKDSTIKTYIETWYQNNLLHYSSKLEDIIFCNDRNIDIYGGFKPNGSLETNLYFYGYNYSNHVELLCSHITDQFSLSNPQAQLTYPIALMTNVEAYLLYNNRLLGINKSYWLMFSYNYYGETAYGSDVNFNGNINGDNINNVNYSNGVRPVISLKPGTNYIFGDGSKNNPYIVE